jgi:hypothetical protein
MDVFNAIKKGVEPLLTSHLTVGLVWCYASLTLTCLLQ